MINAPIKAHRNNPKPENAGPLGLQLLLLLDGIGGHSLNSNRRAGMSAIPQSNALRVMVVIFIDPSPV